MIKLDNGFPKKVDLPFYENFRDFPKMDYLFKDWLSALADFAMQNLIPKAPYFHGSEIGAI